MITTREIAELNPQDAQRMQHWTRNVLVRNAARKRRRAVLEALALAEESAIQERQRCLTI